MHWEHWELPMPILVHTGAVGLWQVRVVVPPPGPDLRPQASLTVTVTTGTPTTVALGAIDTAVLALEPRHRLGPTKVTPQIPHLAPPKPGDPPPPANPAPQSPKSW